MPHRHREGEIPRFWTEHRTKVRLTKNRYVHDEDFEAMYGAQLAAFREVIEELDPQRVFGSMFSGDVGL